MKHNFVTADDLLGKDVIDKNGALLGTIDQLFFSKDFSFQGISIDRGFIKDGLFISKTYIERVSSHMVFLNTRPVLELRGVQVFDKHGTYLGKVGKISVKNGNELESFQLCRPFRKPINISENYIKSSGEGVFLNIEKEELKEVSISN